MLSRRHVVPKIAACQSRNERHCWNSYRKSRGWISCHRRDSRWHVTSLEDAIKLHLYLIIKVRKRKIENYEKREKPNGKLKYLGTEI